jgi:hypothetical protein
MMMMMMMMIDENDPKTLLQLCFGTGAHLCTLYLCNKWSVAPLRKQYNGAVFESVVMRVNTAGPGGRAAQREMIVPSAKIRRLPRRKTHPKDYFLLYTSARGCTCGE